MTRAAALRSAWFTRQPLLLTLPLVLFIGVFFLAPIGAMLWRAVSNPLPAQLLPQTAAALATWDGQALPPEPAFAALAADIKAFPDRAAARLGAQLNFDRSGMNALMRKTARETARLTAPFAESLPAIDAAWRDPLTWVALKVSTTDPTLKSVFAALDLRTGRGMQLEPVPEESRIYLMLFGRTFWVAALVTLLCLVIAYPLSYVLATSGPRVSGLLMILLLLPFWTSLLVRTTAWIALLQSEGVVNDVLVAAGLVDDKNRVQLVYNMTGTLIAMTHILLPFMVLPLYAVMKGIDMRLTRAASSLGAKPLQVFFRVYLPLSLPGVAAGGLIVFILAIGYYITPALVGGASGQLISNWIAFHMQQSLNWGLAAALGAMLLFAVIALYLLFNRLAGAGRLRFG